MCIWCVCWRVGDLFSHSQRPEKDIGYPALSLYTLSFETGSLTKSGSYVSSQPAPAILLSLLPVQFWESPAAMQTIPDILSLLSDIYHNIIIVK